MPKRLGIFGGTFDPVHLGHLRTAEEALESLDLDRVLFIPSADPPHKPGCEVLAFEHRWRMLELSIAQNPRFGLSDLERRLPGKSYTVNSLRKLGEEFPGAELFFLIGLDAFLEIDTWYKFTELFRLAEIVVLRRPGFDEGHIEDFLSRRVSGGYRRESGSGAFTHPEMRPVHYLRNTRLDISSTRVRELAARGRSVRYLVPREVAGYIYEQKFYEPGGRDR
ncbi:MAG: nicotinate-nucleotide adenylyltransferase [Syntrophobacteraceae bacterium]